MIAIYARQSVEKEDSISIESQIEMCTYEARGEAFLIYKDKGFSGKNTNRPEFQRMMQDIKTGCKGITKVIVYKLDRISRSILDFSNMMDTFGKLGVEFSSATEKFDTSTPMGRAMLNICITFAQLERETTQQRVKDNYISRSQKGFYMGGPVPVGFKKVDLTIDGIKTSMYEQIPDEVELVKKVFEMYADVNYSNEDIAKAVRDMPPECRRNRSVTRARIQDFIKNPVYVKADINVYNFFKSKGVKIINLPEDFIGTNGCYLYTGSKNTRKQTDLSNAVLVLAPHEGFIDSDLWIRCRERALNQQQIKRNPKAKNTWLAGLVKCGKCCYALVRKNYVKKNISYFLCSHRIN
ncbi:MAG: recombinase family protein, partial [Eubacterium sp.]|nr:recombinase family protein [Eubacterium sp.]